MIDSLSLTHRVMLYRTLLRLPKVVCTTFAAAFCLMLLGGVSFLAASVGANLVALLILAALAARDFRVIRNAA